MGRKLEEMCGKLGGYGKENQAQFMAGDYSCAPEEDVEYLKLAVEFDRMEYQWRQYVASIRAELEELRPLDMFNIRSASRDSEPIHSWFGLTYANYLVLPRSALQSMPHGWQERFVMCLEELNYAFSQYNHADSFKVMYRAQAQDDRGRFATDPFPHYQRGRTFVPNLLQRERPSLAIVSGGQETPDQ
jgi:hypothetical protein